MARLGGESTSWLRSGTSPLAVAGRLRSLHSPDDQATAQRRQVAGRCVLPGCAREIMGGMGMARTWPMRLATLGPRSAWSWTGGWGSFEGPWAAEPRAARRTRWLCMSAQLVGDTRVVSITVAGRGPCTM